ncbi:MAG: T9SS type A sorting domain-containing protein [Bacteroidales bacterium]|jgi:hypothetical protein|nr:T9SS type A sorting domain-containing protein [Bacteroidales bacterium]
MSTKTFFSTIFLLLLSFFLKAQNAEQANSLVYPRYSLQSLPVIVEGKDRVWDFSGIGIKPVPYGGKLKVKTDIKEGVFNIDCFDGRTVSRNFLNDNVLYQSNVERLDVKIVYDDPKKLVRFPLIYNFEFEQNFTGTKIDKSSKTENFSLRGSVEIAGVGKLILPNGTFVERAFLLKNNKENFAFYADGLLLPLIEVIDNKAFFNDIDVENFKEEVIKMPSLNTSSDNLVDAVSVYPNPANDLINIDFDLKNATNINLLLQDISGKQVAQKRFQYGSEGLYKETLSLKNLGIFSATYFLVFDLDGQTVVKTIVLN